MQLGYLNVIFVAVAADLCLLFTLVYLFGLSMRRFPYFSPLRHYPLIL